MSEIKLSRRIKYAGDVYKALIECGWSLEVATSFVNRIPDADAVEVVRCKDRVYYRPQNQSTQWNHSKRYCMRKAATKVTPNDYCSYGERKENT